MKKFFPELCIKQQTHMAFPGIQGWLLITLLVLLLFATVGCYGNNGDNEHTPYDIKYLDRNDNDYSLDEAETPNSNNSEHNNNENGSANFGAAHQNNDAEEESIIELKDPHFAIRMLEIQMRREYYLGRTIRFEGMFLSSTWGDETIFFIARIEGGGGCCGFHGFEVYLNDFNVFEDETWVEVTGILEEFYVEDADHYFFRLNVIDLVERQQT